MSNVAVDLPTATAVQRARKQCVRKFLHAFPKGFRDHTYLAWERDYKWEAHMRWEASLPEKEFKRLLTEEDYLTIAQRALAVEGRTNLLFSFEKMALRDAVRSHEGARIFALALHAWLHGRSPLEQRFATFVEAVDHLPRKQTRVLTWPLVTVFGFLAQPTRHVFLKPQVTKAAAEAYAFPFHYRSRPNWDTYQSMIHFCEQVREDLEARNPKDMIDLQSFIRVLGSPEYG